VNVDNLLDTIDKICPLEDAFEDDKVGLLIGARANTVSGIVVSHDLDLRTLQYCKENQVNTVISYHPATYRQFDNLNEDLMLSKLSLEYYKENINVISIHTAQDVSDHGNADILAGLFNLRNIKNFGLTLNERGVGRIGEIEEKDSDSMQKFVKEKLRTEIIRTNDYFKSQKNINTIALVPGSGTQFLQEILGKVDLFITGDVSHHHFLLADEYEMGIIQLNHISTEKPGMKIFTEKLNKILMTEIEYLYNEYYE
jgi:dinuclear metal center YbgI/SA1388 family protein